MVLFRGGGVNVSFRQFFTFKARRRFIQTLVLVVCGAIACSCIYHWRHTAGIPYHDIHSPTCGVDPHGPVMAMPGPQWRERAEAGEPFAQYEYGTYFYNLGQQEDRAVPSTDASLNPNYKEAFRWYITSYSHGELNSIVKLSQMYASGLGTRKDIRQAYKFSLKVLKKQTTKDFKFYDCYYLLFVEELWHSLPDDSRAKIESEEEFNPLESFSSLDLWINKRKSPSTLSFFWDNPYR